MACHWPPWNEYSVSHHTQRSGQPVRRTNTVGQPIASASPWIEWKISVMRRRSAGIGATDAAPASLPITATSANRRLQLQSAQAFLRQAGGAGIGVFAGDLLQRGLAGVSLLELELAVADLQQRVGRLLALREL